MPDNNVKQSLEGVRIMWVEDDKLLSDLIAAKLSEHGATMFYANNGEDAWNTIKDEQPDLVLLDILLPGMDGFEVLEKIKGNEETKGIKVILFSNLGQQKDIDKGMDLGASRFLVKSSVLPDDVIGEIKQVLAE